MSVSEVQNLFVQNSFVRIFDRYQDAFALRSGRWDSALLVEEGKIPARFVADVSACAGTGSLLGGVHRSKREA